MIEFFALFDPEHSSRFIDGLVPVAITSALIFPQEPKSHLCIYPSKLSPFAACWINEAISSGLLL
jgi:hypothetical protein